MSDKYQKLLAFAKELGRRNVHYGSCYALGTKAKILLEEIGEIKPGEG